MWSDRQRSGEGGGLLVPPVLEGVDVQERDGVAAGELRQLAVPLCPSVLRLPGGWPRQCALIEPRMFAGDCARSAGAREREETPPTAFLGVRGRRFAGVIGSNSASDRRLSSGKAAAPVSGKSPSMTPPIPPTPPFHAPPIQSPPLYSGKTVRRTSRSIRRPWNR